jgi:hypothetical protein
VTKPRTGDDARPDPDCDPARDLAIHVRVNSDDELRALRGALLAARASELSELQRRAGRHNLGYGSDTARDSMTDEVVQLRRRWEMLDRLIAALESAASKGKEQNPLQPRGHVTKACSPVVETRRSPTD